MNSLPEIPWLVEDDRHDNQRSVRQTGTQRNRTDLLHVSWLKPLLMGQGTQFIIRAFMLAGFVFTISAGLLGTRVGSHNFAIIIVWIAWWTALKLGMIPIGGRSWCSICPIPLPGDWLQQGGILTKGRGLGLKLRWPRRVRGSWLQSGAFLLIGLFSAVTLTDPRITGWVFLALFGLAIGLSLVFEKRAFCNHICPIGGFSGIYAKAAPVELRVIEREVCIEHGDKSCYHACPWGLYPLAFRDNAACGLCLECLRACPVDNLAINLRPFGEDLRHENPHARLDETYLALIMLGSALAFAAVFVGPWGWLKSAAYTIGSLRWAGYALSFLALNLLVLPGLFGLAVLVGHQHPAPYRRMLREAARQAQALLPLGLMGWIAFTVSFALPKIGYVLGVINDPFGWGWKLLGVNTMIWSPDVSGFSPILQVLLLATGLFWSASVTRRLTGSDFRRSIPIQLFSLAFSIGLLWLLIG